MEEVEEGDERVERIVVEELDPWIGAVVVVAGLWRVVRGGRRLGILGSAAIRNREELGGGTVIEEAA